MNIPFGKLALSFRMRGTYNFVASTLDLGQGLFWACFCFGTQRNSQLMPQNYSKKPIVDSIILVTILTVPMVRDGDEVGKVGRRPSQAISGGMAPQS